MFSHSDWLKGALVGAGVAAMLGGPRLPARRAAEPQPQARADSAQLVAHPDHVAPGGTPLRGVTMRNPYAGSRDAIATGARLFVAYNCIDCHGAEGSGAMGPSLADGRFHFGGTDGEIYQSIFEGRPEGMPAWGSTIQPQQIWMLTAYIRSLNERKDPTTEDFTGATVERTGH